MDAENTFGFFFCLTGLVAGVTAVEPLGLAGSFPVAQQHEGMLAFYVTHIWQLGSAYSSLVVQQVQHWGPSVKVVNFVMANGILRYIFSE